ncbi:MAG: hypothetical protein ABW174_08005 [Flavitalea sp.]
MHESFSSSTPSKVITVHVLADGQVITTLPEFQLVESRFEWVSRQEIIGRLLTLRRTTDPDKKSIIAIFEQGQLIREFVNLDEHFPVMAVLHPQQVTESPDLVD